MTETKFTKGPWSINLNDKRHSVYAKRPGYETRPWMLDHLFSVATTVEGSEQERIANAALIAASPEMYEFVKFFTTFSGQACLRRLGKPGVEIYDSAVKLCAKARGEKTEK